MSDEALKRLADWQARPERIRNRTVEYASDEGQATETLTIYHPDYIEALERVAELAAKSEQVTIGNKDGLRRAIQGVLWNASNYPAKVTPHMLGQDVGPLTQKVTDAVIAHLAAQPVTGSVEYGIRDDAIGHVTRWGGVNFMVDAKDYPGYTLVQRTVSEWAEVPNE